MRTNMHRWDSWYRDLDEPQPYGDSPSYQLAADYVEGLDVADWGCGKGWMRHFIPADHYTGIDGSTSPFADVIADLATYTTPSPAIVIRHVLEHDRRWRQVLRNAAVAAQERLVVVLFTPLRARTREIARNSLIGVPDISFDIDDLLTELAAFDTTVDTFESPATQYKTETMIYAERIR